MEKAGFVCVRTEGDHFVYVKPGIPRPVVIPDWDELPVFIIRNNLRTAGLTREDYFDAKSDIIFHCSDIEHQAGSRLPGVNHFLVIP